MSRVDITAKRHDPTYLSGGRAHWAFCSCGWQSNHYAGQAGVQAEFAKHLIAPDAGADS